MSRKKQKKKREKKKSKLIERALMVLFSVVIALSLFCVAGVFVMNYSFLREADDPKIEEASRASDLETPQEHRGKSVNILVAGVDYTEKAGNNRGKLSDVIVLVSFDIEGKTVDVLQIPRDTYVGDVTSTGKINSIYGSQNGGINGLMNKVNQMFLLPIDHYVTINMDGFVTAVDAIGGVEVDVPQSFTLEGVTIKAGKQVLDGLHAEKFVRERKAYSTGDLKRMEMQKLFMEALLKKAFTLSFKEAASLASALITQVTTDMTLSDMLGYYQELMEINLSNIRFHTLPIVGATANGQSVLSIKRYPTADLLNEYFRPYQKDIAAKDLGVIELVRDYEYIPPNGSSSSEE